MEPSTLKKALWGFWVLNAVLSLLYAGLALSTYSDLNGVVGGLRIYVYDGEASLLSNDA